ncbi:MAG TPA: GNAT family N-acetyltransferase [Cyclobacteriaceae bacterium]
MFNLQPITLSNELIKLVPLKEDDFEKLFQVASDPLIWEQHPTRNRYQRDIFQNYFNGAVESKGAFVVYDAQTNEVAGSSRYYEFDELNRTIKIGYTFIARKYWGKGYNPELKSLMMNYAFQFVDSIIFEIGAKNIRSQIAMERIGGIKIGEGDVAYSGEQANRNFIYKIDKIDKKS